MNRTRSLIAGAVVAGLVSLGNPLPATAAMIGTQAALNPTDRAADIARAQAFDALLDDEGARGGGDFGAPVVIGSAPGDAGGFDHGRCVYTTHSAQSII